jgi:CheY-like chemotaxis protein
MNILVCDDSALARKSLSRCLDAYSGLDLYFAKHGKEAIKRLEKTNIDLLFLDLTMPVMDGFEVLERMPVNSYPTQVVVISGDVQKEAQKRCLMLGVSYFIEKPFLCEDVLGLVDRLGSGCVAPVTDSHKPRSAPLADVDAISKFKEVTNIALGQSAAIISDHVGEFIQLPIPAVGVLDTGELKMTIEDVMSRQGLHSVAQRFVGGGIYGEALVCMRGKGIATLGKRLGFAQAESNDYETLLNVSNLLVSSYLNSLAHQLVLQFFLRQPIILDNKGREYACAQHIEESAFAIEYTYFAEELDFECEVLFLLDSSSVKAIYQLMENF